MKLPRTLALLIVTATCPGPAGCVPSSSSRGRDDLGHRRIDARALRCLQAGTTNKSDVLARLGTPNVTLADGRFLVYSWATRSEVQFVDVISWGTRSHRRLIMEDEQVHFLAMEFDDDGILLARRQKREARLNLRPTSIDDVLE